MKKQSAGGSTETPATETVDEGAPVTAPTADAPPPAVVDEPVPTNPHEGGCYVRKPDGTLIREED